MFPAVEGEVEQFVETFGPVREFAFERLHDARIDPSGDNVARTSGELEPTPTSPVAGRRSSPCTSPPIAPTAS
jgi:gamma-butyrobetaine dioxygenase